LSWSSIIKKQKIKICKSIILPAALYGYEIWSSPGKNIDWRVFEIRELRRLFGHKREEVAGGWRGASYFVASPNTIRVITSRRMRWSYHVAHIGKMRNAYKILVRRDCLGDLGIDGKITFGRCGLDSSGSGQGPVVGIFDHSNKPLGSLNAEKFVD